MGQAPRDLTRHGIHAGRFNATAARRRLPPRILTRGTGSCLPPLFDSGPGRGGTGTRGNAHSFAPRVAAQLEPPRPAASSLHKGQQRAKGESRWMPVNEQACTAACEVFISFAPFKLLFFHSGDATGLSCGRLGKPRARAHLPTMSGSARTLTPESRRLKAAPAGPLRGRG